MTTTVSFPPFRLDLDAQRLWKQDEELHLRSKPFAILNHLVHNPQRLVTREELVGAVWGKLVLSESLVRTHVHALRQVLGEGFVETVHGRGYRFTAELHQGEETRDPVGGAVSGNRSALGGRDMEIDALGAAMRCVRGNRRATAFVHGEAGVGKTALMDVFLERASNQAPIVVGRGACVERYGSGQAYLPILDAIGAMCRGVRGDRVLDVLANHAPTWLAQLPGLLDSRRLEDVQRRAAGSTQARMLRELAQGLDALSFDAPVVLVIEDLQWADPSTAEVLAILCTRRDPARLLVLGTYRPAEVPRDSPLGKVVSELLAHRQASSIAVDGFDVDTVEVYVRSRFPQNSFPSRLFAAVHRATGGNPLFLSMLIDDLVDRQWIREGDEGWEFAGSVSDIASCCPDGIARLIDSQIDRLTALEQRVLEMASIVGTGFTVAVVASVVEATSEEVECCCESLTGDPGLLRYVGTEAWPDGTTHSRYEFRHILLQQRALARSFPVRVRAAQKRVAQRLEARTIAPEDLRQAG